MTPPHTRETSRAYRFGAGAASDDSRPLVALDVDGVIVLDDEPVVPVTHQLVTAFGKWRREVAIPDGAAEAIATLAERCELAWASAWSYNAHEALRSALSLPEQPWAFLPAQFDADAVADYAAGRRWAWITETGMARSMSTDGAGMIVGTDGRRGLPSVDLGALQEALGLTP